MTELAERKPFTTLLVLIVLQVFLLSVQVRNESGKLLIRSWSVLLVSPITTGIDALIGGVSSSAGWAVDHWLTKFDNDRLRRDNQRLRYEVVRLKEVAALSGRLEELGVLGEHYDFDSIPADVVWRSAPYFQHRLWIGAGSRDGVIENAAAVTPEGIVGRVLHSNWINAEIELITSPGAAAGALVGKDRRQGIVSGQGNRLLRVLFIPNSQEVELDTLVVTSGMDRIYPKGFPIGRVVRSEPGPMGQRLIEVLPSLDLTQVESVAVMNKLEGPGSE